MVKILSYDSGRYLELVVEARSLSVVWYRISIFEILEGTGGIRGDPLRLRGLTFTSLTCQLSYMAVGSPTSNMDLHDS